MIIGGFAIFFGSSYLIKIFSQDPKVIEIGTNYLTIASFFIPAFTTLQISISLM